MSLALGQAARDAGIAVSMGSRGDCFDSIKIFALDVVASFFATLTNEHIRRDGPFPTSADLRLSLFDYIEILYNRQTRHSTPGYLSPDQYEKINLGGCAPRLASTRHAWQSLARKFDTAAVGSQEGHICPVG